ncbi:STAS domain-containing protein [Nocardia aurea]|uniref:Anti-sigma factor antagonist n=1 Tax=Nocardia aurea TaxID=2144174 RepID=A0ABV3FRP7_9NOCA
MTSNEPQQQGVVSSHQSGTQMESAVEAIGAVRVLRVSGEIDVLTAPRLHAGIEEALRAAPAEGADGVVVDLSNVTFLASAGLAVLAEYVQPANQRDRLVVVANSSATLRPMSLTGLTDLLRVCQTLEDAHAALGDDLSRRG